MEMASFRDVEQGMDEDGDNLRPLLPPRNGVHRNGVAPAIGSHSTSETASQPEIVHPRVLKLTMPESVQQSAVSTPGSTPPTTSDPMPRRWRRSDRRQRRLNTELLEAIETKDKEEFEKLLAKGASPNATCRLDMVSACHMAALSGGDYLQALIEKGAERQRQDSLGRTPLHLAAWAGNSRQTAILLDFPEVMYDRVDKDSLSSEAEEEVKKLNVKTRILANVTCTLELVKEHVPKEWKDNIDHNCRNIKGTLPLIQPGWTALHVASACARPHCMRLLLAAGADPSISDIQGRTPLDVAGSAYYFNTDVNNNNFTEVLKMLIKAGGKHNTMRLNGLNNLDTPLHTAVVLENVEAIELLLEIGVSVGTLNNDGKTPLHVCVEKQLETPLQILANSSNEEDAFTATVDVKDSEGLTVLQAAVEAAWVPGVCVALESGADVTKKALDKETPIHAAAYLGNVDVLNEILSVSKQGDFIDCQNTSGETPLFLALEAGHIECVKALLSEGASIKVNLPGDVNVLHKAAEFGHKQILEILIEYDKELSVDMINARTASDKEGFRPLHFAVFFNHPECVTFLIENGADVRLRTTSNPHKESTALHLAALKNHLEIAKIILSIDKTTIHEVNSMGWFPLHTAGHNVSREIIPVLLQAGADLAGYSDGPKKFRRTAIDMIINNVSKPTEFLEDIFDSFITSNTYNLQDVNSIVTLDYSVLMPRSCEIEQMKVIEALLKTGNRYGQERLLIHPLVESFLYFKWKALLPFFYMILIFYAFFLISLTTFVISVFFYKDTHETKPVFLDSTIWGYLIYSSIGLIFLQELLYMNVKSSRYFLQLETWIKFGSIGMASILPPAITIASWSTAEWPRHVATVALLLTWIEMMFLLSRFPNWGYYVLMFGKVATNVVKILMTFAFLVIGFSLSFMIQFRSQMPFEGPWAAIVKTIVMMTSEFDYEALFDEEHTKELSTSIFILRIIFVVFLVLAAIVLMNLMVGVAVNDINDLEILGNIRRLAKQVEFLSTLDTLVYNKFFSKVFPNKLNNNIKKKRNVSDVIEIYPARPRWRHTKLIPTYLRDAIFNKATVAKKQLDDENAMQLFSNKIDQIYEKIVTNSDNNAKIEHEDNIINKKRYEEVLVHLGVIDDNIAEMKSNINVISKESAPMEAVQVKIDQIAIDLEDLKQYLVRLESKIGKL